METAQREEQVVQLFEDNVFFKKDQIVLGTRFVYMGRSDPGAVWEVVRIFTYDKKLRKDVRVSRCHKLNDEVQIRRVSNTNPTRRQGTQMFLQFAYFSYSAIWRIHKQPTDYTGIISNRMV